MVGEIARLYAKVGADLSPLKSGLKSTKGLLKSFGSSLKSNLSAGLSGVKSLAQGFFYVGQSIEMVIGLAGRLGDALLGPAIAFERQDIALTALLGSQEESAQWWKQLSDFANRYALDLAELQEMAPRLAVLSEGDLQIAENYAFALAQIKTLAPQLPQQRVMGAIEAIQSQDWSRAGMLLDLPETRMKELAQQLGWSVDEVKSLNQELSKEVGHTVTYIEGGITGTGESLKKQLGIEDVNAFLSALGATPAMMEAVGNSMSGKLEQLQNHWLEFRQTVGADVLDALAGPLDDLLTWLEENKETVLELATAFGTFLADGIKGVIEFLKDFDWEGFIETISGLIDKLVELAGIAGLNPAADKEAPQNFGQALAKAPGAILSEERRGEMAAASWGKAGEAISALGIMSGRGDITAHDIASAAFTEFAKMIFKSPPQKVEVEVTSDNAMFDAKVKQTANNAVADGLNQLSAEMAR